MTRAEEYRLKAQDLKSRADNKRDLRVRLELELIARKYSLLAEQAARNSHNDVVYEPVIKRSS